MQKKARNSVLLNHQQRKILELLCKTEHVTASELAGQLGIGVKTVRVRIKELNPELEKKGIQILSKSRYGYYLDPRQPEGIVYDLLHRILQFYLTFFVDQRNLITHTIHHKIFN